MSILEEFEFNSIYKFCNIISNAVDYNVQLFNFNEEYFISSTTKFRQETVLHQYIVCELLNHYSKEFSKNNDLYENEDIEEWCSLFNQYNIQIDGKIDDEIDINEWFSSNRSLFTELFNIIAEEVFFILFANRSFLLKFNNLISVTVQEFSYPSEYMNLKGRIKRVNIPQWVKRAVFFRDKGRCIFCNTDLTSLVNTLINTNYDHIVSLDQFGINDISNIQLSCEKCNKSKTNKEATTSKNYFKWF